MPLVALAALALIVLIALAAWYFFAADRAPGMPSVGAERLRAETGGAGAAPVAAAALEQAAESASPTVPRDTSPAQLEQESTRIQ